MNVCEIRYFLSIPPFNAFTRYSRFVDSPQHLTEIVLKNPGNEINMLFTVFIPVRFLFLFNSGNEF